MAVATDHCQGPRRGGVSLMRLIRSTGRRLRLLVAVNLCCSVTPGCGDGCGNTLLSEVPSPHGVYKAVVFERNCGATTPFSTQVSILGARERLGNEAGNAFRSDTDHGAAPSGRGGGPAVEVRWTGVRRVVIRHHPRTRVSGAEERVGEVTIDYAADLR